MAINMMDIVEKSGDKLDTRKLGEKLGCEVVKISALKGTGVMEAAREAVILAEKKCGFSSVHTFSGDVERLIEDVQGRLGSDISKEQRRFFAIKLLEKDSRIQERMETVPDVSDVIGRMEEMFDDDTESIITNERYLYISSVLEVCYKKGNKEKLTISDRIDRVVTNRWLALPIFAIVMFFVYYVSVTTVGTWESVWSGSTGDTGHSGRDTHLSRLCGLASGAYTGWHCSRCWRSVGICTADACALPVSGVSGVLWIHGESGVYHGQSFSEIWPFRKVLYTDSDRYWMWCAGNYGFPDD